MSADVTKMAGIQARMSASIGRSSVDPTFKGKVTIVRTEVGGTMVGLRVVVYESNKQMYIYIYM